MVEEITAETPVYRVVWQAVINHTLCIAIREATLIREADTFHLLHVLQFRLDDLHTLDSFLGRQSFLAPAVGGQDAEAVGVITVRCHKSVVYNHK